MLFFNLLFLKEQFCYTSAAQWAHVADNDYFFSATLWGRRPSCCLLRTVHYADMQAYNVI